MGIKTPQLPFSRIILLCFLILTLALIGKIYYDTNTIEIRRFQIANSSLSESLADLKLAFISDLHTKRNGPREKEINLILEEEKPDFILLGGDFISFKGSYEPAIDFLNQLGKAYAVLGNTEYSNENGSCILCHHEKSRELKKSRQPVLLRNSFSVLEGSKGKVSLIGVDDPVSRKSDLPAAIRKANPASPKILLAHSPEIFEEAVQSGVDVVLAGHNHGGQIFLVGYLRKMILMDPGLEYLEGFYQKGKTLMYVSRGVGTSFLPFRLGVKPEVAFFTFSGKRNETGESMSVSNSPPQAIFSSLDAANLRDIFDIFQMFFNRDAFDGNPPERGVLFDFESEAELNLLDWTCQKWFERSTEHATSGTYSLKITLPPGQYPGVNFARLYSDWSNYRFLKMDLHNPAEDTFTFHVRIDDEKSGWKYADRFDMNFEVKKGTNMISIPTDAMKTNLNPRPLNLKNIKRFMVFVPDNQKKKVLFVDNIRLE
jgi:predicted MPP superfamily phosphohydrolase